MRIFSVDVPGCSPEMRGAMAYVTARSRLRVVGSASCAYCDNRFCIDYGIRREGRQKGSLSMNPLNFHTFARAAHMC